MLGPLTHTAFTVFDEPTTWAEVAGFATGVVNVWLVVRQHILNWPIGILNVVLLGLVFLDGKLYADAGLQLVYVVLQAYGWWQWIFGGQGRTARKVARTSTAEWVWLTVAGLLGTAALTWMLSAWTDSTVPFWDALTTAISLVATYGQCRKLVESWWLWIAADLVYIPLYLYKGLNLTATLYLVFLALCLAGLVAWQRDLTREQAEMQPA